jgi:hypothetical protein
MQESQWAKSQDAVAMLRSIPKQPSDRKLRLLACACCRHFQEFLTEKHFSEAIEIAESFADGKSSKAALKRARQSVQAVRHALPANSTKNRVEWVALWLVEVSASENAFGQVAGEIQRFVSEGLLKPREQAPAASLLRCILGNPFQHVAMDPRWRSSQVLSTAKSIYDEAVFDRLPQLAKELKNAGCRDTDILKHCRNQGPHVRGCWVIDQLLAKS